MTNPWYPDYSRRSRVLRAVGEVLRDYVIERSPADPDDPEQVRLHVWRGHRSDYRVVLRRDWSAPPTCSCPDHAHGDPETRGHCKHTIAACLSHDDLRCQVLDLFL